MPWIAKNAAAMSYADASNCSLSNNIQKSIRGTSYVADCSRSSTNKSALFFVMLSVNLANAVFGLPIRSYFDPVVISLVESHTRETTFNKQRQFGGVGFGCATLLAGVVSDHFFLS